MNKYILYKCEFPNGKIYIGITSRSLEARVKDHRNSKKNNIFHKMLRKHKDEVVWSVLFQTENKFEIHSKEQEFIKQLNCRWPNGYNYTDGGEFHSGYKLQPRSEEHKNKIREAAKQRTGPKNAFYGKTHSEETKEKIRKARLGKLQYDNRKKVKDSNGNIFNSVSEAAASVNWSVSNLSTYIRKGKLVKGIKFEYA